MPTIFYDVTEMSRLNRKTGIQRVTWEIFNALMLLTQNSSWEIVAVIGEADQKSFRPCGADAELESFFAQPQEKAIQPKQEDIFLGVDLHYKIQPELVEALAQYRIQGCLIFFVVYDILPIIRPELFSAKDDWFGNEDFLAQFTYWLTSSSRLSAALISISKTTQSYVESWLDGQSIARDRRPRLAHFRLGNSHPKFLEVPPTAQTDGIFDSPKAFLMVGTLEPRKGHTLALDAFDILWNEGKKPKLVIIGKPGWKSEALTLRIQNHPHLGANLFYLDSATDDELAYSYTNASALLSISEAEGFGLPNIEAASYGLPILARDIEVFREVCGDGAYYLANDLNPQILARNLQTWIGLADAGTAPSSAHIKLISWRDSTLELLSAINIKI